MQRSGGANPVRIVVIACALMVVILSVLYFMKRLEATRLSKDLDTAMVSSNWVYIVREPHCYLHGLFIVTM